MKNIYDVLRQKENQIQQLEKEIEALKLAARLLEESEDTIRVPEPIKPIAVVAGTPLAAASRVAGKENGQGVWDGINKQFP